MSRSSTGGDGSEALHTRLRMIRTERGLSRKELAAAVGVHFQTIGYIERGEYNPSLVLGLRIARHFDLPVEALFALEPFAVLDAKALTRESTRYS